ncbi:hypothetical protein Gotur_014995 [Gossypium turneri]
MLKLSLKQERCWNVEVECDNALLVELLLFDGGANSNIVELRLLHQVLHRK